MLLELNFIAKRYAVAFLNIFEKELSEDNLKKWQALVCFLQKNTLFYVYLRIPVISRLTKQKALIRVAQSFDLKKPIVKMIMLLLDHGRIEILDKVLMYIILLYRRRLNTKLFRITSSHGLNEQEKKIIIDFTKTISKSNVEAEFVVNEKLIVGLRIQSLTFLWERSISKQLRGVKRSVFKQVGLW